MNDATRNDHRSPWAFSDVECLAREVGKTLARHSFVEQSDLGNPGTSDLGSTTWAEVGAPLGRTAKAVYSKAGEARRYVPEWQKLVEDARLAEIDRLAVERAQAVSRPTVPTVSPNVASALADLRQAKVLIARALAALGAE